MVTGVVQDKIFYTEVKLKQKRYSIHKSTIYDGSFCKAGTESQTLENSVDVSPGSSQLGFVKGETPGLDYLEHHLYVQGFILLYSL